MGRLSSFSSRCKELIRVVSDRALDLVFAGLVLGLLVGLEAGLMGAEYPAIIVSVLVGLSFVLFFIGFAVLFKGNRQLDVMMGEGLCLTSSLVVGVVVGAVLTAQIARLLSGNA